MPRIRRQLPAPWALYGQSGYPSPTADAGRCDRPSVLLRKRPGPARVHFPWCSIPACQVRRRIVQNVRTDRYALKNFGFRAGAPQSMSQPIRPRPLVCERPSNPALAEAATASADMRQNGPRQYATMGLSFAARLAWCAVRADHHTVRVDRLQSLAMKPVRHVAPDALIASLFDPG